MKAQNSKGKKKELNRRVKELNRMRELQVYKPGPLRPRLGGTGACVPVPLDGLVTWLYI